MRESEFGADALISLDDNGDGKGNGASGGGASGGGGGMPQQPFSYPSKVSLICCSLFFLVLLTVFHLFRSPFMLYFRHYFVVESLVINNHKHFNIW